MAVGHLLTPQPTAPPRARLVIPSIAALSVAHAPPLGPAALRAARAADHRPVDHRHAAGPPERHGPAARPARAAERRARTSARPGGCQDQRMRFRASSSWVGRRRRASRCPRRSSSRARVAQAAARPRHDRRLHLPQHRGPHGRAVPAARQRRGAQRRRGGGGRRGGRRAWCSTTRPARSRCPRTSPPPSTRQACGPGSTRRTTPRAKRPCAASRRRRPRRRGSDASRRWSTGSRLTPSQIFTSRVTQV